MGVREAQAAKDAIDKAYDALEGVVRSLNPARNEFKNSPSLDASTLVKESEELMAFLKSGEFAGLKTHYQHVAAELISVSNELQRRIDAIGRMIMEYEKAKSAMEEGLKQDIVLPREKVDIQDMQEHLKQTIGDAYDYAMKSLLGVLKDMEPVKEQAA